MNIHNMLVSKLVDNSIGRAEVLAAYDKGFISIDSVNALINISPKYDTVELAIKHKSAEFNYFCSKSISQGIDVTMEDGTVEHFSLSTADQLNINRNITNALMGMKEIEYHADGGPQKVYSVEDMNRIYSTMQAKINSETTYRNNLREWIQKLKDFEEIRKIQYGDEIPEEYWTDGWRDIQTRIAKALEDKNSPEPEVSENSTSEQESAPETTENEGIVSKVVNAVTKKKTRKKKAETE